ncbi:SDR family NAD(P)-dependent oxidoreductase [Actinomycetes bacterium KLBMP 9797]
MDIADFLATWVADRCGRPVADVDRDRPLFEFGLSSVDAVELAAMVEARLGRSLPATLVWQYPTVNALARALVTPDTDPRPVRHIRPPRAEREAVAIVGVGCRFPGGVDHPDALWRLLTEGRDAIGAVPPERWRDFGAGAATRAGAAGRWGGFLDDVAAFDAEFFGISAGEARQLDPQQRLLLEVTWEALQHAAIEPARLAGSRTGVYVGICVSEYTRLTTATLDTVEGWTATGGALSIAANRLSYLLDLRGPSMAVDTACSSSLVATHLAVRALRAGEIDAALVGGVNLLLTPILTVAFGQAGGLAPGGRCRPFDAAAEGIVRSEGCGVIVLKRLADAVRDGDRVLAVVRGSAVNSDGRSGGLVAPNPQAQESVLREAYADAGLDPADVDYVEAHGTGTPLGDPIEAGALGAVCGIGRLSGEPLPIGSLKSNLGHLEAAAGIAGIIKAALVLRHGTVPATIHCDQPNPRIPFGDWGLRVPTAPEPLADRGRPARAGVSGFGFGGTNAHVVLEAAGAAQAGGGTGTRYCVLSDRSAARVRAQAAALARWLDHAEDAAVPDVAGTLIRRGARGSARAVVVAADRDALRTGLRAVSAGTPHPDAVTGEGGRAAGDAVWVFSGYGTHWPAMGRELLAREPAFAAAVDELEPAFTAELGASLRGGLESTAEQTGARAQPLTFGVQVALAALWRAYGVAPAAVLGHSMGEVAAAVVAGALAPAEGVRVIARRAEALSRLGPGAMAVVELAADEFDAFADGLDGVYLAVLASPRQIVVTGAVRAVRMLVARADATNRMARMLTTEGAGHSPAVDPLLSPLAEALAGLRPAPPAVPFYSTVVGDPRAVPPLDAAYWAANLRSPVRLAHAIGAASDDGFRFFLEISPHPVLVRPIRATLEAGGVPDALVTGTLRRDGGAGAFARQLAILYAHGLPGPPPARARILDLPAAPWQRRRYWVDAAGEDGAPPALRGLLGLAWEQTPAPAGGTVPAFAVSGPAADPLVRAAGAPDGAAPPVAAPSGGADSHVVVVAPTGGAEPDPATAEAFAGTVVRHATTALAAGTTPRLWFVTRGAAALPAGAAGHPDLAWVRGAVRSIAVEQPRLRATWLDLDPADDPATQAAVLRAELAADAADDEVAWRAGRRYAARVRVAAPAPGRRGPVVRPGAAYLVTGGYRGVGLRIARWLAEAGAARLVLSGRSGPPPESEVELAVLRELGTEVRVVRGDLAEPGAAEAAVAAARDGGIRLAGVVHGAGVRADRLVTDTCPADLARVWGPKARGAWRLDAAVRAADAAGELDWWVSLSSAAALLGSPGQTGYAGANAWLDAFAAWQRARGVPALAIHYGTWARVGGAAALQLPGLRPIEPDEGIAALAELLAREPGASGVVPLDAATAATAFPEIARLPFFAGLLAAGPAASAAGEAAAAGPTGAAAHTPRGGAGAGQSGAAPPTPRGGAGAAKSGAATHTTANIAAGGAGAAKAGAATHTAANIAAGGAGAAKAGAATHTAANIAAGGAGAAKAGVATHTTAVGDQIGARIAAVLGAGGPPARDTPLLDLGLDSLAAVRIKNLVETDFGVAIPTSVLVRGVTLRDLERAVAAALGLAVPPESDATNGSTGSLPAGIATDRSAASPFADIAADGSDASPPAMPAGIEPRDAAERLVLWAVRQVLGPVDAGVTDRLDRLGGPPDALHRIVGLLRQRSGVDFGAGLLAAPTAERLAAPLRAADEAAVRCGGPLRELRGGNGTPLFLAHPAGGSTIVYQQLLDLMGTDNPSYGLERLDDDTSIVDRAARYVAALTTVQPCGPYQLAGWSFGGAVVFEMARQLAAARERVDVLALIDAGLPVPVPPARAADLLVQRFVGFAAYLRETYGVAVRLTAEELRLLPEESQFELVLDRLAESGLRDRLPAAILRHQITSHRDTRALDRYQPGVYTGPVVLYRCTEPTPWNVVDPRYEHVDPTRGFGDFCPELRVVPVAAHHLNVLDPPAVETVAADLGALLRAARYVPVPGRK